MTQIAPATLIAIQSYAAPTAAKPAAPGGFEPIDATDLAPRRDGSPGEVRLSLSADALAFLGGGGRAPESPTPRAAAAPRASADAYRTEPPGSRLDITV